MKTPHFSFNNCVRLTLIPCLLQLCRALATQALQERAQHVHKQLLQTHTRNTAFAFTTQGSGHAAGTSGKDPAAAAAAATGPPPSMREDFSGWVGHQKMKWRQQRGERKVCLCVRCVCLWLCVMVVPCLKVDIGLLVLARTWSVCAVDLKERRGLVFEYLSGHFYVWW